MLQRVAFRSAVFYLLVEIAFWGSLCFAQTETGDIVGQLRIVDHALCEARYHRHVAFHEHAKGCFVALTGKPYEVTICLHIH